MGGFTRVRVVRYGELSVNYGQPDKPDIQAAVTRIRPFRWRWQLFTTGGRIGEPSYAWTEGGAWAQAVLAALRVELPKAWGR